VFEKKLKRETVLLDKKEYCKERFVLKIVPNKEEYGQAIRRFRMSYKGPE
jgi:hypothetical protein